MLTVQFGAVGEGRGSIERCYFGSLSFTCALWRFGLCESSMRWFQRSCHYAPVDIDASASAFGKALLISPQSRP